MGNGFGFPGGRFVLQSPVEIAETHTVKVKLEEIQFNYATSRLDALERYNEPGTGFQPVAVPRGSFIEVNGGHHDLLNIHTHTPAEHTINGRRFPGELHLVHTGNGDVGFTVVAVLIDINKNDDDNDDFTATLLALEGKFGSSPGLILDLKRSVLPQSRKYFRLSGGLTAGDFNLPVDWHVMQEPILISLAQMERLRKVSDSARNMQPSNNRVIIQGI